MSDVDSAMPENTRASVELSMAELFRIAAKARDRAPSEGDQVLVAIAFSIIAFESTVNDLMAICSFPLAIAKSAVLGKVSDIGKVDRFELWPLKARVLAIYESISAPLNWEIEPWLGLDNLIRIRNEITHRHAITGIVHGNSVAGLVVNPVKRDFQPYLISRNLISKQEAAEIPWQYSVKKPNVAEWALETCIECVSAVISILPDGQPKRALRSEFDENVRGYVRG